MASSLLSPQVEPVLAAAGTHFQVLSQELPACTYIAHHSHSQVDGHNAAVREAESWEQELEML